MATKLRFNREKLKQTLSPDEKINQLTPEQREKIGEFRLSIIREGLEEFPGLDPMDAKETSKVCARKECGKTFSGRSNKIYCSPACTKKMWDDVNRPGKKSQTNT